MRFAEEERLIIIAEGEKNGVRAVCAKYGISDQTYRLWRYRAQGTKPRKHFSLKKKLKILEEGAREVFPGPVPLTALVRSLTTDGLVSWVSKSCAGRAGQGVPARKRSWRFLRRDTRMGSAGLAASTGFLIRLITTGGEGWVIAEASLVSGISPD